MVFFIVVSFKNQKIKKGSIRERSLPRELFVPYDREVLRELKEQNDTIYNIHILYIYILYIIDIIQHSRESFNESNNIYI